MISLSASARADWVNNKLLIHNDCHLQGDRFRRWDFLYNGISPDGVYHLILYQHRRKSLLS